MISCIKSGLLLLAVGSFSLSGCGSSKISEEQAMEQEQQDADAQDAENASDGGGNQGKQSRREE